MISSGIRFNSQFFIALSYDTKRWFITCNKFLARRGFPEKRQSNRFVTASTVAWDKFSGSTSTFRGKEAWDRVILNPGTSPPALSCQPPPVVNICSTIITAWMSESKLAVRSVTRSNAARMAPAKMLLVPKPLPWGAVDQVWSSNPAWYFLCSWALNGSLDGSVTMSRRQKQALRRAPKEESAIKRTLYYNQELSSFS